MAGTKYTVLAQFSAKGEFESIDYTRSDKQKAVAYAETFSAEKKVAVKLVTDKGTEVFSLPRPPQRIITVKTKPYTKVVELPEDVAKHVPEGYVPAYFRPRNGAFVLRNEEAEADDRYLVLDIVGTELGFAATTRAAGKLMEGAKANKVTDAKPASEGPSVSEGAPVAEADEVEELVEA